jgi:hypothetical protein
MDNTSDRKNRETNLSLPKPNTDFGKRCFKYNGAVVWIKLPYEVKLAESFCSFKRTINQATLKLARPVEYIVNSNFSFFVFVILSKSRPSWKSRRTPT